jgi:uncharacterized SAM-binding protein YcdF (DUF218 family)
MDGLESLKPLLTALVLPPVPWLVLILLGARWRLRRPRLGHALVWLGVALVWLGSTQAVGRWLQEQLDMAPAPLSPTAIEALKAARDGQTAIVVLGGGLVDDATQPGQRDLSVYSLERLRYGIRLARATGLPLAFTGGLGWAQREGNGGAVSEADAARRSAELDFGYRVRWTEPASRDTRENTLNTVELLWPQGVRHVVLVTHASHMPRAVTLFRQAGGPSLRVTAAPMGQLGPKDGVILEWMPTNEGFEAVRFGLREWLGQQVVRFSRREQSVLPEQPSGAPNENPSRPIVK